MGNYQWHNNEDVQVGSCLPPCQEHQGSQQTEAVRRG